MKAGFLSLAGIWLMTTLASAQQPLRIACVGDSITYGDKLSDRAAQSYPAVLERLSQGRFTVGNFGVNGTTASKHPVRDWTQTDACREALAFAPAIVVIMLGINDLAFSAPYARYPADLRDLVVRFQALASAPRVYLCTLTPIAPEEQQAYANQLIRETMIPAIRAVAAETGAPIIDVAGAFPNRIELLPDGLHPSPAGAELIARTVLAAIAAPPPAPQIQPAPADGPVDVSIRHEALAAQQRAELWLKNQPPPPPLRDPRALGQGRDLRTPEDVAELLPLLAGSPTGSGDDFCFSAAALAVALDRIGRETVFLADGHAVAWRAALLHQLVQRQKIDARGGGYWSDGAPEDAGEPVRSTAYALQAIAAALGE